MARAVDSTAFPDESDYVLLEDGFFQIEADGTGVRRIRIVRQILKEGAVNRAAELSFAYDPSREEFDLEWARVVTADGTVLSAEPSHVPAVAAQAAPHARGRVVSWSPSTVIQTKREAMKTSAGWAR